MIIKNKKQLTKTELRKDLLDILEAGYRAISLKNVLQDRIKISGDVLSVNVRKINLKKFKRVSVCGIGKCALETAKYLEKIIGEKISEGIVLDTRSEKLRHIQSFKGDHPLPSLRNLKVSQKILKLVKSLDPKEDLLIFIVSGGGSSLFFVPEGIEPEEMIRLSSALLKSGASIHEVNIVRKHLSLVQGGKLGELIRPLPTVALYFSDVVSETNNKNLETIASGPLYTDKHTSLEAKKVLQKYGLWSSYKKKIFGFSETVKEKTQLNHVKQELLLTNTTALQGMVEEAKKLGLRPKILSSIFTAEADQAFDEIKKMAEFYPKHNLFIIGGEMTIRVRGRGRGGRNQQAVLASLIRIKNNDIFLSAASDGVDNTIYAGALGDAETLVRMARLSLRPAKFLQNNDSFTFFKKVGDYIRTGKTGVNVADLMIYFRQV